MTCILFVIRVSLGMPMKPYNQLSHEEIVSTVRGRLNMGKFYLIQSDIDRVSKISAHIPELIYNLTELANNKLKDPSNEKEL